MSSMKWLSGLCGKVLRRHRPSYGAGRRPVQSAIARKTVAVACAFFLSIPAGAAADKPVRIVALGDSLMAGYELAAPDAFAAQLEKALKAKGIDASIENAGVSGDTASGGLSRLDWSVPDGTDAVIVELGANDMLRGIDPSVTRDALEKIIVRLKERGIAVLLAGMRAAPNLGTDYAGRFDAIYPELAAKHGVVFQAFFLDGVAARPNLLLRDGMHPNADGVKSIVAGLLPKAEELIARVRARRGT